ncbi:hypothetical protein BDFB_010824 [Asbolus verrucosus]|uniref:Uncharacterized protein n=1 Tax=Asbolus verrucosus TaxID=1661398 RepID=A0A482WAH2_ASBVE|nr:hypothetical protein BDFB_010824 [Asbolus verrucosus]
MKNTLKWKRAGIIYPTDHIISSTAREIGYKGFKPEYENVKHVNMRFIMSNEYMRLWFKQRDEYIKENYSKAESARNETTLKRGYVQRMMTNPRAQVREYPFIQLKRFQNIISRIDNGRTQEEKVKICGRYKKTILPTEMPRYKPACPHKPTTSDGKDQKFSEEKWQKPQQKDQKQKAAKSTPKKAEAPSQPPHPLSGAFQCQLVCPLP